MKELIKNKNLIQQFLDNLNCDDEKWFVYNCDTGDNPTLRKFSHRMSYRIMNNNTEMFKSRFLYLKVNKDMNVSCEHYRTIKFNDMDIDISKYRDVGGGYIRSDLFGELTELFSDDRIYTIHYIEALGPVDPHRDPWTYDKDYRNIIFYDNIPKDAILKIGGKEVPIISPQSTNFGNEEHTYQFSTRQSPLKILHIDYELS